LFSSASPQRRPAGFDANAHPPRLQMPGCQMGFGNVKNWFQTLIQALFLRNLVCMRMGKLGKIQGGMSVLSKGIADWYHQLDRTTKRSNYLCKINLVSYVVWLAERDLRLYVREGGLMGFIISLYTCPKHGCQPNIFSRPPTGSKGDDRHSRLRSGFRASGSHLSRGALRAS
jgi:hypothetical protein